MDQIIDLLKADKIESKPTFYEILGCGQNATV